MGTRLYPTTQNEAIIEILAGVPAGTHKALNDILIANKEACEKAKNDGLSYEDIDQIKYYQRQALGNSPEGRLDGFLIFGWGKLTYEAFDIVKAHIPSDEDENWLWNGDTTNVGLIDSIMEAQGVDLEKLGINPEDLEGLSWG
jgi:hypothetical protein